MTSKFLMNRISLTCKQLEKKTLNGKILTNCKEFVKFVNIFPCQSNFCAVQYSGF